LNPSETPAIPHSRPSITARDVRAVDKVLRSGRLTTGEAVASLEAAFSKSVGRGRCIAVSSGTAALHLALLALPIREEDEVLVPSYLCPAAVNAVLYLRARPVLVDLGREGFNPDAAAIRRKLTGRTRAVLLPHMFGYCADAEPIKELGVPILEDCAMALGTRLDGAPIGRTGPVAVYSFYSTKMIASGQGGMAACDDPGLEKHIRDLRSYDKKEDFCTRFNYALPDFAAALALSQLQRLDGLIAKRRKIAVLYQERFKHLHFAPPPIPEGWNAYRYIIRIHSPFEKARLFFLRKGVEVARPVFTPLHRYLHLPESEFPNTERLFESALSLPLYPDLGPGEVERVVEAVTAFASIDAREKRGKVT
jgi:perosamine synthetase